MDNFISNGNVTLSSCQDSYTYVAGISFEDSSICSINTSFYRYTLNASISFYSGETLVTTPEDLLDPTCLECDNTLSLLDQFKCVRINKNNKIWISGLYYKGAYVPATAICQNPVQAAKLLKKGI